MTVKMQTESQVGEQKVKWTAEKCGQEKLQ